MNLEQNPRSPSIETMRMLLANVDKFEKMKRVLGTRFAIQNVRAIKGLHTYY